MKKLSFMASLVLGFTVLMSLFQVNAQPERVTLQRSPSVSDIRPADVCVYNLQVKHIAEIIKRVKNAVENKNQRYESIASKVKRIIVLAEGHGVETSELRENLEMANAKMERFNKEAKELVSILQAAQKYACQGNRDAYNDAIKKARQQMQNTKKAAADARIFINGTLIPSAREVLQKIREI